MAIQRGQKSPGNDRGLGGYARVHRLDKNNSDNNRNHVRTNEGY